MIMFIVIICIVPVIKSWTVLARGRVGGYDTQHAHSVTFCLLFFFSFFVSVLVLFCVHVTLIVFMCSDFVFFFFSFFGGGEGGGDCELIYLRTETASLLFKRSSVQFSGGLVMMSSQLMVPVVTARQQRMSCCRENKQGMTLR